MSKKARAVLIEWHDAAHIGHGWRPAGKFNAKPVVVRSVGFVTRKNRHSVFIVQSITGAVHGNLLQIPRGMIQRIKKL